MEGETKQGMEPQVGNILEGKVTTITKFGAFVALEGGRSGLVHISEIANTYVNDVRDYLQEGQSVRVLVLPCEPEDRSSLCRHPATRPLRTSSNTFSPLQRGRWPICIGAWMANGAAGEENNQKRLPAGSLFHCLSTIKKSRAAQKPCGPSGWDIGKLPGLS